MKAPGRERETAAVLDGVVPSASPNVIELGRYRRRMAVSMERMFENALDWEHLPHLHAGSFADITLLEEGPDYWVASTRLQPERLRLRQTVRLSLDREAGVWVTEVLEGFTRGLKVHTQARELGARSIEVDVRFLAPSRFAVPRPLAWGLGRLLGPIAVSTYRRLYDEDERMMLERQAQLDRSRGARLDGELRLGTRAEVLRSGYRLPISADYRVAEVDGELVAFHTVCPHLLGPLGDAPVIDGQVRCPWHGYRFDVRTGQAVEHRLRLRRAPRLEERDGVVWACPSAKTGDD